MAGISTGKGLIKMIEKTKLTELHDDIEELSIDQATLFKREHVAKAVAKVYAERRRSDLLIAKLTTKNGKRQVLEYEKPKRQTKPCP